MSKYGIISGLILNHLKLDGTNSITAKDAIEPLSEIDNITKLLNKYYYDKNKQVFKTIVDKRFKNIKNLIKLVEDKEAEKRLQKLEEEEEKAQQDAKATSEQVSQAQQDAKKDTPVVSQEKEDAKAKAEQEEKEADTNTLFEAKLKEMEAKLPPKLGNAVSYTQVADKEFCYKFLYCWLNNPSNQKNPNAIKVCNSIIDTYGIEDDRFPKSDIDNQAIQVVDITFDVGFIINIEPTKRGGSTIPTQKRRPNKPKKRNHTIKDRVRVKTR